jgi:hypothetical protein
VCCVHVLLQVAYHASRALLQYIRAHLLIHLTALQRRLRDGPVSPAPPTLSHTCSACCCLTQMRLQGSCSMK